LLSVSGTRILRTKLALVSNPTASVSLVERRLDSSFAATAMTICNADEKRVSIMRHSNEDFSKNHIAKSSVEAH
jgi:hypothetical protein